jgi:hypothetical protein
MSRGIQVFKQTDVTKAIKGAQNAALDACRFEIDRAGKIALVSASTEAPWPLSKDNEHAGRPDFDLESRRQLDFLNQGRELLL